MSRQVISVGIGYAVKRVPTVVESSEALGQWLGAALLIYFGLRTLKDAWGKSEEAADDELADATAEGEPGGEQDCFASFMSTEGSESYGWGARKAGVAAPSKHAVAGAEGEEPARVAFIVCTMRAAKWQTRH